jgi:ribonuclease BN (tRNA processing enzyme)
MEHSMPHTLIPLGLNGYIPTFGRHTTSFLLLSDEAAILLDAGTGIARLAEPALQERLAAYDTLHVVLSHYHLDHVIGLFYLSALAGGKTVHVLGPAPPLTEYGPEQALGQLMSPPLSPRHFTGHYDAIHLHDIGAAPFHLGGIPFTAWPQRHPGGSIGLRIGHALAYLTDRAMDPDDARHVRGVDLLLHEVWLTDAEAATNPEKLAIHSSAGAVADFARLAGVARLMPMHHHPARSEEALTTLCADMATRAGLPVIRPVEGQAYPLAPAEQDSRPSRDPGRHHDDAD